jgi:polysaccharide pyruvyl transferase WcaK-like protein
MNAGQGANRGFAMHDRNPRLTLLGNNAGRNVGDMAIMSSIMECFSKRMPGAEFYVPSTNPEWTRRNYGARFKVRALSVMPWTASLRLLGLPTLYALAKSDIALICDGIIFGNRLLNPAFNYLITLVFIVPLARLLGCKVVCYSCGIGPLHSTLSRLLAKWTINGCDLVMMRDQDSVALARQIGVTRPIELTGDPALINPVSPDERACAILSGLGIHAGAPILAINVTAYLDQWLQEDERLGKGTDLIRQVAEGISLAKRQVRSRFSPLVIATHPMDEAVCHELAARIGGKVLLCSSFLSHDIQAVLRRCGMLLGMRFHSLVLASSVTTPVMALVYAPKVRGYMRTLESDDVALELAGLTPPVLAERLAWAWDSRQELQSRQVSHVQKMKAGAERAAEILVRRYFSPAAVTKSATPDSGVTGEPVAAGRHPSQ